MRLNNLSARLIVNDWLAATGRAPLGAELSYTEFASELRKVTAPGQVQTDFISRADATAYVRLMAQRLGKVDALRTSGRSRSAPPKAP